MTASTPQSNTTVLSFRSAFPSAMDTEATRHCPPCLPSPRSSATMEDDIDFPTALALPVLAPRAAIKHKRRQEPSSSSLMDFVSHMSLNDVTQSFPSYAPAQHSSTTPDLQEEEESKKAQLEQESFDAMISKVQEIANGAPFSLTTPETLKNTITTPQAFRLHSAKQKRQTPLMHSTPVNGNRPLMLPSLSDRAITGIRGRSFKKAKNYKTLLSSAPMLPSSPDLEDRFMAPTRYHAPMFSPPSGGVTLVNPNFRGVPNSSPAPDTTETPRRPVLSAATAAGLPSLDEAEQSAPKPLRFKKRTSLLTALRLSATSDC